MKNVWFIVLSVLVLSCAHKDCNKPECGCKPKKPCVCTEQCACKCNAPKK